jgi:ABC-2 type transport system ATP-binding protein
MAAIKVESLAKTYRVAHHKGTGLWSAVRGLFRRECRTIHAVAGISFSIHTGEMVAFLGPNGAGKTTTLKMLSGLIYPSAGTARVLGFTPWERSNEYRRRFALVMGQKNQLWWDLPASESFRLHREIYGIPDDRYQRVCDELIDLLGVAGLVSRPVRELSLGERMKMELVAALLHSPEVLFLDEPTIGLDVVAQTQMRSFLKEYNRTREVTVLLTSHYMKDVESLCDRAIVINHGRLVYDGSLAGIQSAFSSHKILKLEFSGVVPAGLEQYGQLVETRGPVARLLVDRQVVAATLAEILDRHQLDDITVEEVPLEEVIAEVFQADEATVAERTREAEPTTSLKAQ